MAFTRDQAYSALASLKPAPVFLDSYRLERLPEDLNVYFGPPEEFFIAPDTQALYTRNRLVPILDDGNFGLVTFLDPETRVLIQMDLESLDEPRSVYRHWQQYLADLMIRVSESVDEDERVRRMAVLVGFAHIDELFAFFERAEVLNGDVWWEKRRQFPFTIPVDSIQDPADRTGEGGPPS